MPATRLSDRPGTTWELILVPRPRCRVISPSSSSERSAERTVGRLTLSFSASSGSLGSQPCSNSPPRMERASSSLTRSVNGRAANERKEGCGGRPSRSD